MSLSSSPVEQHIIRMMKNPRVVGPEGMILRHQYDPDQLWFDFMAGTIFEATPEPPPHPKHKPQRFNTTGYARKGDNTSKIYVYERGVEQYVLPFKEFQRISNKEFNRLAQAGYPGFDKRDGTAGFVNYERSRMKEFEEWCQENVQGRYHISKSGVALFERSRDFTLAWVMYDERKFGAMS